MVAGAVYSLGTCFGPLHLMVVCSGTIRLNFDQFCQLVFSVDSLLLEYLVTISILTEHYIKESNI